MCFFGRVGWRAPKAQADEQPDCETGNLLVVLHEEEHLRFQRRGADLFVHMEITLGEALLGFRRVLEHLDGRRLVVTSSVPLELSERPLVKAWPHGRTCFNDMGRLRKTSFPGREGARNALERSTLQLWKSLPAAEGRDQGRSSTRYIFLAEEEFRF